MALDINTGYSSAFETFVQFAKGKGRVQSVASAGCDRLRHRSCHPRIHNTVTGFSGCSDKSLMKYVGFK